MAADGAGEFEFISHLRERFDRADHPVGIGDDTAVLADGTLAAVDTIVDGRHVRLDWCTPQDVGWKALAVNLSDIAAMGGHPTAALAAVTLPPDAPDLADELASGLLEASRAYDCPLVGGDTTSGSSLVLSITVLGRMPAGAAPVLRSGARPGDTVFVTGTVGLAAAALDVLSAGETPPPHAAAALHRPLPRLAEGQCAARVGATAMIDISDGLGADLGHILDASDVGADIAADQVPVADGVDLDRALQGGDDYELCFTAPDPTAVRTAFEEQGLRPPVAIGVITDGERSLRRGGVAEDLPSAGWTHPIG